MACVGRPMGNPLGYAQTVAARSGGEPATHPPSATVEPTEARRVSRNCRDSGGAFAEVARTVTAWDRRRRTARGGAGGRRRGRHQVIRSPPGCRAGRRDVLEAHARSFLSFALFALSQAKHHDVCPEGTPWHRLQCARQCAQTRSEEHHPAPNVNQAANKKRA